MLHLAEIFQNKMMLQREKAVPVWGTAEAGETISVSIQGVSGKTMADAFGSWQVILPPLQASCKLWEEEALPFLIVQLPAWESWFGMDSHGLEVVRLCQQKAAEEMEAVWLSTSSDLGEKYDVHPKEKRIVGQRLALLARGKLYGEKVLCEAPKAESICITGKNRLEISFLNAAGGLKIAGERLSAMHVFCGEEEVEFTAETKENRLILEADFQGGGPVRVAVACDSWFQVNLYNQAYLPALPFEMRLEGRPV